MTIRQYVSKLRKELNESVSNDPDMAFLATPVRFQYFRPYATLLTSTFSFPYIFNGLINQDMQSIAIGYAIAAPALCADTWIADQMHGADMIRKGHPDYGLKGFLNAIENEHGLRYDGSTKRFVKTESPERIH